MVFHYSGKLSSSSESAFIISGFSNWNDATRCFMSMKEVIISRPKSCSDVGVMLSSEHALQKKDNQKYICRFGHTRKKNASEWYCYGHG